MDTAHIDKKHIEAVASKFEESGSTKETVEPLKKGKSMRLRGAEDIFQHSELLYFQSETNGNELFLLQARRSTLTV